MEPFALTLTEEDRNAAMACYQEGENYDPLKECIIGQALKRNSIPFSSIGITFIFPCGEPDPHRYRMSDELVAVSQSYPGDWKKLRLPISGVCTPEK